MQYTMSGNTPSITDTRSSNYHLKEVVNSKDYYRLNSRSCSNSLAQRNYETASLHSCSGGCNSYWETRLVMPMVPSSDNFSSNASQVMSARS